MAIRKTSDKVLREHVIELLNSRGAHTGFDDVVKNMPEKLRGVKPDGFPHSAWMLLEHLRLAQWDILEFSRNPKHQSPGFPDGYWPKTPVPPDASAWDNCVNQFQHDLKEMIKLVQNPRTDLFARIPHGDGQTILREALILADHNSYHLGQLVDLRRGLGAWPEQ